jgi:hypothetical protein
MCMTNMPLASMIGQMRKKFLLPLDERSFSENIASISLGKINLNIHGNTTRSVRDAEKSRAA